MPILIKGMGRRICPDARDRQYPMRSVLRPTVMPRFRYYDTANRVLPLDQGHSGTCVAFAWTGFLYAAPMQLKGHFNSFDLYRRIVLVDEWDENDYEADESHNDSLLFGTSVRAGVKALRAQGRIRSYVWARNANEMANWILGGYGTIVVGTNWYYGMSDLNKEGFGRLEGGVAGGHAYLVIGYNRVTMAFRCLNSWGLRFGNRGRFWIRHADMERLIRAEDGEACAATEQLVHPV